MITRSGTSSANQAAYDAQLLVLIADVGGLYDFVSRFGYGQFYLCGVVQDVFCQLLYLGRHGSGEHDRLTFLGEVFHNLHDIVEKPMSSMRSASSRMK